MPATDQMIARLEAELEERDGSVQALIGMAEEKQRDLTSQEMTQISELRGRMNVLSEQLEPLRAASKIAIESRRRMQEVDRELQTDRSNKGASPVEYRSAGAYIADFYDAHEFNDSAARNRLEVFNRVAAHQTTTDNPGLLPESIVAPVLNFVDESRPLVTTLGPVDPGSGSWAYAKITQHTQVTAQSAEKAEFDSRKMLVTKTAITAPTYGGYVNVSRQDINRTSPQILDMVINDLAGQYAIATETACGTALIAGATAGTAPPVVAGSTPAVINAALWAAAATVYTNTKGAGRLFLAVSPDMMGIVGPAFAPVNPQTAYSPGFSAGEFASGATGSISGIPVVMSPVLAAGTALLVNSAGVLVFEHRYGALQVVEPSVWGVQVGYAGDFQTVVIQTGAIIAIDTTA